MNQPMWPTLSTKRTGAPASRSARAEPRGKRAFTTEVVDMSAPRSELDANGGEADVHGEQRDDAQHQGLVDRGADALRAAGDGESAVAPDQAGDETEDQGLYDRDEDFGKARHQRQRRHVRACGDVLDV